MDLSPIPIALSIAAMLAFVPPSVAAPDVALVELSQDHMVDHPAGAHYVLWNGPALLDVGLPAGNFVRFSVVALTPQWSLLLDAQGIPLPVAVRRSERGVAVRWLPYDGPVPKRGTMSDAEYLKALQNISAARYQGLMSTARGINGTR